MTSAQLAAAAVAPTVAAWDNPPAVAPRGTVILIAGRGEHPGLYERFGNRIAFDGYRVRVVGDPTAHERTVTSQINRLLADPDLPAPRVLAGSDAGAAFAAALVAAGKVRVDGLILVGLPGGETTVTDIGEWEWETELGERTACPTHQARLDADVSVRRGALTVPISRSWIVDGDLRRVAVPVLGLHGTADLLSPLPAARERYTGAPIAEFVTIDGGKHDALNDATHRTAAAVVVLFLERLRAGADLPEIARWTPWS
ncbi:MULTISPECIES: alpha/beta hydrolase [Protofrankia]|uniref:Lysophospholipase n=1 Tax=Candidatus Protofrankia datiscae TaxID=2716812 RepID=F8B5L1_9ACTN|nr:MULTISPECIES: lysophospholipase [Protofrankia]AEH09181.1 hypothetical protein FsymDg_1731 [Candidatus Protofrankia datiscae]